jgi:hypothetical protein
MVERCGREVGVRQLFLKPASHSAPPDDGAEMPDPAVFLWTSHHRWKLWFQLRDVGHRRLVHVGGCSVWPSLEPVGALEDTTSLLCWLKVL